MGPIHRRAIEIPTAAADANAVALAYATANAPLGEKKETPAALANASARATDIANAPPGEKQMKRKTITVRSECHIYQGRAEWEHWKTKHEP